VEAVEVEEEVIAAAIRKVVLAIALLRLQSIFLSLSIANTLTHTFIWNTSWKRWLKGKGSEESVQLRRTRHRWRRS